MSESLKVLAVGDPAVYAYVDSKHRCLARYEELNAVRVQFDIIPWESYCDRLFAVFRGDEEYDIVMIAGHLWLKDYVASSCLAPVSYPVDGEWDGEDILPVVRQEMVVKERHTCILPFVTDIWCYTANRPYWSVPVPSRERLSLRMRLFAWHSSTETMKCGLRSSSAGPRQPLRGADS